VERVTIEPESNVIYGAVSLVDRVKRKYLGND